MAETNENSSESVGSCSLCSCGCFECVRMIANSIANFPFRRCFKALPRKIENHIVAFLTLFMSFILVVTSWFEFSLEISLLVSVYCIALIVCSGITFILPRGYCCTVLQQESLLEDNSIFECQRQEVHQLIRERADGSEQQPQEPLNLAEQRRPASNRSVIKVDVHYPDQPSESSNSDEPAFSSSDELLLQAGPSNPDDILPQSSDEQSTQSTASTTSE